MEQPESDFDGAWKRALEQFFVSFLALFFPVAHSAIDWSQPFEFRDTELQQIAPEETKGKQRVDTLVRVVRQDGTPAWVLIHIEVQSQRDSSFAERMFRYVRGQTQGCIASAGGWYGRECTRDTHATWRGNLKGKTASWESG